MTETEYMMKALYNILCANKSYIEFQDLYFQAAILQDNLPAV